MSYTPNIFTNQLALEAVLTDDDLYETRLENDAEGRPLYVGKNITPNADVEANTWYIKKLSYDENGYVNHIQLPDDGIGFNYVWSDRATYFS